jgi:hypothetical protein
MLNLSQLSQRSTPNTGENYTLNSAKRQVKQLFKSIIYQLPEESRTAALEEIDTFLRNAWTKVGKPTPDSTQPAGT